MAISRVIFIRAIVILAVISAGGETATARAQSPSPMTTSAPAAGPGTGASDCTTLIYNMSDCLTFVEKGSNESKPDKACCPELAGMLDSNPICLCQLLGKSKDFPVELDVKRALRLPDACGVQTPPLSLCSVAGIPIGGPAGAPTSSQGPSSAGGLTPEAGEPSPGKNGASNANRSISQLYLVATLAILLLTSFTL